MFSVYITAHRGMGITAKRRDHFIKGAKFFPENSIAAFKEAIRVGAEALECDIHVSSDHVPIVIHGSKVTDYAYYIGDRGREFESDENKTCESFTVTEIKQNFALKTFEGVDPKDKDWGDSGKLLALQYYLTGIHTNPDLYAIPTLEQLLELVSDENERRISQGMPTLKLNIELKGKDSGFLTLATIADFHQKRSRHETYAIDFGDIILLGRMAVGEIAIAKNLLKGASKFLEIKDSLEDSKERHLQLSLLFGEREIEIFLNKSGWTLYLTENPSPKEEDLPENFPGKVIILTTADQAFLVKNKRFFRMKTRDPKGFPVEVKEDVKDGFQDSLSGGYAIFR